MTVTRRAYNAVMNVSGTSTNTITVGVPTDTGEGDLMLAVTSQPTGTPCRRRRYSISAPDPFCRRPVTSAVRMAFRSRRTPASGSLPVSA